jgi:Beta galactosidase small chain
MYIRWISLSNQKSGKSIVIIPNSDRDLEPVRSVKQWGWNASQYSMSSLTDVEHNHELRPHADGRIYVHVDSRTMGVGG